MAILEPPGGHFGFVRFLYKGLEGVHKSKKYFAKNDGSTLGIYPFPDSLGHFGDPDGNIGVKYQRCGTRGTSSLPAKSKMATRGPKLDNRVWEGVYP